ncbi:MAG: glycosyltransferase [Wujia sp.]
MQSQSDSLKNKIIVIPAYKPDDKLVGLVRKLSAGQAVIVIVNDGSGDAYNDLFGQCESIPGVHLLKNAVNMGKGAALKHAFNYVLNNFPDASGVVTADADGQHTVEAICTIIDAVTEDGNVILGKRRFTMNDNVSIPLRSRFGNVMTRAVFRFLCGINISDTQTGLRWIPDYVMRGLLTVAGDRYEYETNCLLWCKDNDVGMREIEIETIYEDGNKSSHFNPIRDSVRIYSVILRYTFASMFSVIVDYVVFGLASLFFKNVYVLNYLGRICSGTVNFMVNKKVVFRKKGNMVRQALMYMLLCFISGTVSAFLIKTAYSCMGGNLIVWKMIAETFLFLFNYYIQKNFIFKK